MKHFLPTDLLLEATTSSTASPSRAKGKKSAVRHAESVNPVAFYADDGEQGWRQLGWLRADSFLGRWLLIKIDHPCSELRTFNLRYNQCDDATAAHGAEEDAVLGSGRGGRAERKHLLALSSDVRCVYAPGYVLCVIV